MLAPSAIKRRFQLMLIKPSHYDDDGYVVQWLRSHSSRPTRSLASTRWRVDAADRQVLGPDVDDRHRRLDETNTRVKVPTSSDRIRQHDGFGMVGLVGVQSNQFPRAHGHRATAARGRHPGRDRRLPRLRLPGDDAGDAGRPARGARHRLHPVRGRGRRPLRRACCRPPPPARSSRSTTSSNDLPDLESAPTPFLPRETVERVYGRLLELRRRPRLPVPVLVLHHHQRAGAQVAPALAG